jgi:hypothetical protein
MMNIIVIYEYHARPKVGETYLSRHISPDMGTHHHSYKNDMASQTIMIIILQ